MKGQISFVEYLAALTLFIFAVLFIALQLVNFIPQYLTQINDERVRIDAYQISEILVNDPGNPANWESRAQIFRMGLSNESVNETDYLSLSKIEAFNNYCNPLNASGQLVPGGGYANIRNNLTQTDNFAILLFNRTANSGNLLIICQPPNSFSSPINTTFRRIVAIDSGDIGELDVQAG